MGSKSRSRKARLSPIDTSGGASQSGPDGRISPKEQHPYHSVHREWLGTTAHDTEERPKAIDKNEEAQSPGLQRWLQQSMRDEPYNNVAGYKTVQTRTPDRMACANCVGVVGSLAPHPKSADDTSSSITGFVVRKKKYKVRFRHLEKLWKQPTAEPSPKPDPLAHLDGTTLLDEGEGEDAQFHIYQSRYDARGERTLLQVGAKNNFEPLTAPSHAAALVLTRFYTPFKHLSQTRLTIRSPYLKKALREVVKYYPGVELHSSAEIQLVDEPWLLFHYRKELQQYAMESSDRKVVEHIKLCLQYVGKVFREEIFAHANIAENAEVTPAPEHRNLWIFFKPGDYIYQYVDNCHSISRLVSIERISMDDSSDTPCGYHLMLEQIQCNGMRFGLVRRGECIERYKGYRPLSELNIYPLQYHAEKEKVRGLVLERGRRFISLYGIHHRLYEKLPGLDGSSGSDGSQDVKSVSVKNQHRVVLDWKEYHCSIKEPEDFADEATQTRTISNEHLKLEDEDYLICHYEVPGYCLDHKRWSRFKVDGIKDINFTTTAFDSLVLPKVKKDLISSLVKTQDSESTAFDDVIIGKGKGLIFLLHGPPGVGKTLTAESIAEYAKRPLFHISCADLGGTAAAVEKSLNHSLNLATRWHSVVLLDEADVFMEERSREHLQRNELVSVLLRTLEYFEGIMFLTTNRATSIDPAFKSRIHISMYYPPLSFSARKELWKTFVMNGQNGYTNNKLPWLSDKALNKMAKAPINGRQIKNIVRIAYCRAANEKRDIVIEDILLGLQAFQSFEKSFANTKEVAAHKKETDSWGRLVGKRSILNASRRMIELLLPRRR